jgi:phage tail sheath protein FI
MATYRTPGVYVEEISTFPPSVAEVSTAIPAFLGYTERGSGIARINTLLEYETLFGKADPSKFTVMTRKNSMTEIEEVAAIQRVPPSTEFSLYYSLSLYFKNGGGSCYVVSLGHYPSTPSKDDFTRGLAELEKEDEPTLIVLTDAVGLDKTAYYALCQEALDQCDKLRDRFAILDVLPQSTTQQTMRDFRQHGPQKNLKYGAAYYPYLQTSLNYQYNDKDVSLENVPVTMPQPSLTWRRDFGDKGITVTYTGSSGAIPALEITGGPARRGASTGTPFQISRPPTILLTIDGSGSKTGTDIVTAWHDWLTQRGNDAIGFAISLKDDGSDVVSPTPSTALGEPQLTWQQDFGDKGMIVIYTGEREDTPAVNLTLGKPADSVTVSLDRDKKALTIVGVAEKTGTEIVTAWRNWLAQPGNADTGFSISPKGDGIGAVTVTRTLASIQSTNTALYNQIKAALSQQRVILSPSAAVAGIYAQVDRERGVWKAPANVSVAAVLGPVTKITHQDQEDLNIDPDAGKSINAIREFTGKGTLVWGARTLSGNDNEWRYVPVRRLFNMIEESAQKATAFAVFEPNDAATWLKVKAMIESFLYGLWERGALAGSTPKAAYFVNVGLGKTMTPQQVLEGLMIVEIGVAAVRPAEFIILRFTHKLQEA